MSEAPAPPLEAVPLSALHRGARGVVRGIRLDQAVMGEAHGSTVARRLAEIGFVTGEPFEIIAEVWPGGDPIAVRIGVSMFALRRREAQDVLVDVLPANAPIGQGTP